MLQGVGSRICGLASMFCFWRIYTFLTVEALLPMHQRETADGAKVKICIDMMEEALRRHGVIR